MAKSEAEVWWCLKGMDGRLLVWVVHHYERDCIREAEEWFDGTWEDMLELGYSVVRVRVEEVGG
jgi:hypothetical protein